MSTITWELYSICGNSTWQSDHVTISALAWLSFVLSETHNSSRLVHCQFCRTLGFRSKFLHLYDLTITWSFTKAAVALLVCHSNLIKTDLWNWLCFPGFGPHFSRSASNRFARRTSLSSSNSYRLLFSGFACRVLPSKLKHSSAKFPYLQIVVNCKFLSFEKSVDDWEIT